jgi:Glycosyltransferase family 87/WD40-like Beta Propeller Repeat
LKDSTSTHIRVKSGLDNQAWSLGRWLRIGEWVLVGLLVAHFCVRDVPKAWHSLNNDFPDYYVPAVLVHQHYDTSRIYEWIWLERQKDHRLVDRQTVNLMPSTTLSTLALYPFASMSELGAKRAWFLSNLGLLIVTLILLRDMTQLSWRRIALVTAISYPLRLNFIVGQYYVLLLFLLTLACYLYLRQRRLLAGVLIGIASGLKIFPVLYLLYFLRKRDWRALAGGMVGGLISAVVAVLVFGWQANRSFLLQVLPATLRGEIMSVYALKIASASTLLHHLFIYEPQLNPHPAINAPWLFAVIHPIVQMAMIAPALLLAIPDESGARRLRLEWIAILLASLAVSTSPQAYLFTLLILPACVALEALQEKSAYLSFAVLLPLYFVAGFTSGAAQDIPGWSALLGVPRLYALILCCVLAYLLLARENRVGQQSTENTPALGLRRDLLPWCTALGLILVLGITSNLRHQRRLYDDYQWRLSMPSQAYMALHPAIQGNAVIFVAWINGGYSSAIQPNGLKQNDATQFNNTGPEELAVTANTGERWVEREGHQSTIIPQSPSGNSIEPAESPVISFDGRWLAFLREDRGRARMWIHSLGHAGDATEADRVLTGPELNVLEMSFKPDGNLIFAATSDGRPGLFTINTKTGNVQSIDTEETRYPAVSPDGVWLAYSQFQNGYWNLWLRNLTTGGTQRLTNAECNATEPSWASDSKTLIYASDCGRAFNMPALSLRRVVP